MSYNQMKYVNSGRIWGVPLKRPGDELHPLIEISGLFDIGKKIIVETVARKLHAEVLTFPQITPVSPTGSILLQKLKHDPEYMIRNPQWWSHLYAANLLEFSNIIEAKRKTGPIITSNYSSGYTFFNNAISELGINSSSFTTGMFKPTRAFFLVGTELKTLENLDIKIPVNVTTAMRLRLNRLLRKQGRFFTVLDINEFGETDREKYEKCSDYIASECSIMDDLAYWGNEKVSKERFK